jgi:hypothetical protein
MTRRVHFYASFPVPNPPPFAYTRNEELPEKCAASVDSFGVSRFGRKMQNGSLIA